MRLSNTLTIQIIQGMTLPGLLRVLARNDFRVDARCIGRLAYLVAQGVVNSVLSACETIANGRQIQASDIEQQPLFIIGHWRSGTTHLHNLLSLDERFSCPNSYQAIFPHHFIFSQVGSPAFNMIAPEKRPMDNVAFAADTPHEDEFALAALCGVSPYIRIWFPVTGNEPATALDSMKIPVRDLEAWKESLTLFLKKMAMSEGGRPVLKSPPHMGRIPQLLELFPQAQFLHIVRHPYAVYASTHILWNKTFAHAHLQVPSPELVDELILSWHSELFEAFERDKSSIPQGALHQIKFEDLELKPTATLSGAYEGLGIKGFEGVRDRVDAYLKSLDGYKKNKLSLNEEAKARVRSRWAAIFERYGYEY